MSPPLPTVPSTDLNTARPPVQPLLNPKYRHISRSAAKRESVQLLGSIKDLQRHFAQAATIEHRPGSGVGVKGLDTLGEEEENRDPSVYAPTANAATAGPSRERRPWKEVELARVDIEAARKEVKEIIGGLRDIWGFKQGENSPASSVSASPTSPIFSSGNTHQILIRTAQGIRRIRELSLSINPANRKVSGGLQTLPRIKQGRTSISTPSRPGIPLPRTVSSSATLPVRRSSLGVSVTQDRSDDFADLRKAALEVLAGLRGMEERMRIVGTSSDSRPVDRPGSAIRSVSSTSTDGVSDPSRPTSSSSGLMSEPESLTEQEEADWNMNILAADGDLQRHIETWEERIVNEGREYRALSDGQATRERASVWRWIDIVERIFQPQGQTSSKGRWAEGDWQGRSAERIHSFLMSHIPLDLQLLLPSTGRPDFQQALLSVCSDGYILTRAFNAALHDSSKTWGAISEEDIHEISQSSARRASGSGSVSPSGVEVGDERGSEGWTFRRIGNLTAWAAAIRHRYNLPISLPARAASSGFLTLPPARTSSRRPSSSDIEGPAARPVLGGASSERTPDSSSQFQTAIPKPKPRPGEDVIHFDPARVAKREPGWQEALEDLARRWIEEVAREVREEQ